MPPDFMNMLQIKCPLCRSTDVFLSKSYNVDELILAWKKQFNIDVSEKFRDLQKIDMFQCNCCQIQFFMPLSLEGKDTLYAQLAKSDGYYPQDKWEHNMALKDLKGLKSVLEIGCGSGGFVARAAQSGVNIDGIEINNDAVEEAQRRALNVRAINLQQAAAQFAGHYDAVCAFQVLEHTSNPHDFIKHSCALIRPGGRLILGLPNRDSFLKHMFEILDIPPHHMTRWSVKTVHFMQKLFPVKLEHVKLEPLAEYHIESYVNAYGPLLRRYPVIRYLSRYELLRWYSKFIKRTGLRKLLKGHTFYVSFIRVNL